GPTLRRAALILTLLRRGAGWAALLQITSLLVAAIGGRTGGRAGSAWAASDCGARRIVTEHAGIAWPKRAWRRNGARGPDDIGGLPHIRLAQYLLAEFATTQGIGGHRDRARYGCGAGEDSRPHVMHRKRPADLGRKECGSDAGVHGKVPLPQQDGPIDD